MSASHQLTRLLGEWSDGRGEAFAELVPLVYDELRRIASSRMRRERSDHTLQATDLAHEAFLALNRRKSVKMENRSQFFAAASRVMRNLLVDHARRARAKRRDVVRVRIEEAFPQLAGDAVSEAGDPPGGMYLEVKHPAAELLDLDRALRRLEDGDAEGVRLFEMHFFGGYSQSDIAELQGIGERTVRRRLAGMRRRLARDMDLERSRNTGGEKNGRS